MRAPRHRELHAKLIVIDRWALIGSANLTEHGLDAGNLELGLCLTGSSADDIADRFCQWWERFTLPADRIRVADLPKRTLVGEPHRDALHPLRGRTARLERGEALRAHRAVLDLHDALRELRKGFIGDGDALPSSNSPRMPPRRSKAYRQCAALRVRRATPQHDADARQILIDVLRKHAQRDARAHAAYRLAHDAPRAKDLPEIKHALRDAYADDPALNVRRQAYRALRHLGLRRLWYPQA